MADSAAKDIRITNGVFCQTSAVMIETRARTGSPNQSIEDPAKIILANWSTGPHSGVNSIRKAMPTAAPEIMMGKVRMVVKTTAPRPCKAFSASAQPRPSDISRMIAGMTMVTVAQSDRANTPSEKSF